MRYLVAIVFLLGGSACSAETQVLPGPNGGGGAGGGAGGGSLGGASPEPLWRPTDASLTLERYDYWGGSWRWTGEFAALPTSIQQLIVDLRVVEEDKSACFADNPEYRVTIEGAEPTRTILAACVDADQDACFDSYSSSGDAVIECATLAPLVDALGCVSCNGEAGVCSGRAVIGIDDGCENNGAFEQGFEVNVPAAGTYLLGSGDPQYCGSAISVSNEGGALADTGPACPTTQYTFPASGTYYLSDEVPRFFVRSLP